MAITIVCGLVKIPSPISKPWATWVSSTLWPIGATRWYSSSINNIRGNSTCSSECMRAVCTTSAKGINISLLLTPSLLIKKVSQQDRSRVRRSLGLSTPHPYILQISTTSGWFTETISRTVHWQSRMFKLRRMYGARILQHLNSRALVESWM